MITDVERKLGIFMRTQQLIKELDKLGRQDYEEVGFYTDTHRYEVINSLESITNFNIKS
jgi:hypothetical protein